MKRFLCDCLGHKSYDKRKTGEGRRKALKLGVMTCRSPTHNPRRTHLVPFQVRFLETRSRIKRTKLCSARARQTDWELSFQSRGFQSSDRTSNSATNIPTQTQGLRDRNKHISCFLCYIAKACIYTTVTKHTYHIISLPA